MFNNKPTVESIREGLADHILLLAELAAQELNMVYGCHVEHQGLELVEQKDRRTGEIVCFTGTIGLGDVIGLKGRFFDFRTNVAFIRIQIATPDPDTRIKLSVFQRCFEQPEPPNPPQAPILVGEYDLPARDDSYMDVVAARNVVYDLTNDLEYPFWRERPAQQIPISQLECVPT